MDNLSDFEKCIKKFHIGDLLVVECSLGLWEVQGSFTDCVMSEALHYWQQYAKDGEYSSIIGGKTVIEPPNKDDSNETNNSKRN